jgi:hypothetical protein
MLKGCRYSNTSEKVPKEKIDRKAGKTRKAAAAKMGPSSEGPTVLNQTSTMFC